MLSPAALSVVTKTFDGEERNKALGIWSAIGGGGAAIGVLLGGLLTAGPGWQWVFYVNVPIGVIVFAILLRTLPADRPAESQGRLDVPGAILVTAGTGTAIYALINAGDRGWLSAATLGTLAGAVVLYAVFAWVQRTVRSPLMDLRILTRRPVAAGTFLILVATALMIAVFFLGSFYLQHFKGYGALRTGLLFLPVAVADDRRCAAGRAGRGTRRCSSGRPDRARDRGGGDGRPRDLGGCRRDRDRDDCRHHRARCRFRRGLDDDVRADRLPGGRARIRDCSAPSTSSVRRWAWRWCRASRLPAWPGLSPPGTRVGSPSPRSLPPLRPSSRWSSYRPSSLRPERSTPTTENSCAGHDHCQ